MDRNTILRNQVYKSRFLKWISEEIMAGRIVAANMQKPSISGNTRSIPVFAGSLLFARRFAIGESHGNLFLAAQKRDLLGIMSVNWTHAYLQITQNGLVLSMEADNIADTDFDTERYFALEIPIPSDSYTLLAGLRKGGEIFGIGMVLNEKNNIIGIKRKYGFRVKMHAGLYNPSADLITD